MSKEITIPVDKANHYVMTLPLSAVKIGNRFRQDHGDLDALARSIQELGLLQPIGVDREHRLIFGHRRFLAHQRLGLETIQARIIEVSSLIQAERDENEVRKEFTPSERVAIAEAIKAEIGNRQGQRTDKTEPVENFPQVEPGQKTREVVAKAAGFGNDATYRQAKAVVEKADHALVQAMDQGEIAISTAAKLANAAPEIQREAVANPKKAPALAKATPEAIKPKSEIVSAVESEAESLKKELEPSEETKLERAIKAHKKLLDIQFDQRVKQYLDEILPMYADEYDRYKAFNDTYTGVFTDEEFRLLLSVLHPDRCQPERSTQFSKAFHLIKSKEEVLCKVKPNDRPFSLPSTLDELIARRGRH